jgi:hypothetical protein
MTLFQIKDDTFLIVKNLEFTFDLTQKMDLFIFFLWENGSSRNLAAWVNRYLRLNLENTKGSLIHRAIKKIGC